MTTLAPLVRSSARVSDAAELVVRLDRIQKLTDDLTRCQRENVAHQRDAARLHCEQDVAERIYGQMMAAERRSNLPRPPRPH